MGKERHAIEHGASTLPGVTVDSYNLEIKSDDGWIGDSASRTAFWSIVEDWRKATSRSGTDPFDGREPGTISKKQFDRLLTAKDARQLAFVHSVIEEFANNLATVIQRYLKVPSWEKTEAIVLGGGLQDSLAGQVAIERTALLLRDKKLKVALTTITNDPDEAGLIGGVELVPRWMLQGFDGLLAVDIGGTNIRAGVVRGDFENPLAQNNVWRKHVWRHLDDTRSRTAAIDEIVAMLKRLEKRARKDKLKIAPIISVGCPGIIERDGAIRRGAQNLPGNWESENFNLAEALTKSVGQIHGHDVVVIVHNDAVIQGLSELSNMRDVKHWAVLTIGTGLGNAKFSVSK